MTYNIQLAGKEADKKSKAYFKMPRRKTLQEALDFAARPLTPQQRRIQEKYGDKWGCCGNSEGCIFLSKEQ